LDKRDCLTRDQESPGSSGEAGTGGTRAEAHAGPEAHVLAVLRHTYSVTVLMLPQLMAVLMPDALAVLRLVLVLPRCRHHWPSWCCHIARANDPEAWVVRTLVLRPCWRS
jgi:hypothetical protein